MLELAGPAYEGAIQARIDPDGRSSPYLVNIARFEVVDDRIPSNWRVRLGTPNTANRLTIAPASWLRDGFWEHFFGEYFDERPGTLDAQADYARELEIMLGELG